MRTFISLIAMTCVIGLAYTVARAADTQQTTITGVVIDQAAGPR